MLESSISAATPITVLPPSVTRLRPRLSAPRIVALGGGTGLAVLLRGLRECRFPAGAPSRCERDRLTAIVTVADDGGSSGELRRAYRILAPGDIRECLLALADGDATLQALFSYRFDAGVAGHSLGNLMLTALASMERDFTRAVQRAGELLAARGEVWPATPDDVSLCAEYDDGSVVRGESRIATRRCTIRRVALLPEDVRALPQAVHAVAAADLVVIGPGSLYTSVIPNLLVRGIADALAHTRARVVLAMNLMTEPGETDGYSAADFIAAIRRHAPQVLIDTVLLNSAPVPGAALARYADEGARPIEVDVAAIRSLGCRVIARPMLGAGPLVRHDPRSLAGALLALAVEQVR